MAQERKVKRREGNEIEFSRIVAFSDGVFAIAITLLVLAINVPDHLRDESLAEALWKQRDDMIAYAISFAVIGRFWVLHHRFFGEVVGFDGRLLTLNIFYRAVDGGLRASGRADDDRHRLAPRTALPRLGVDGSIGAAVSLAPPPRATLCRAAGGRRRGSRAPAPPTRV